MKRALIVIGSPRKEGNTRMLVDWVAQGLRETGAMEVERVDATQMDTLAAGCTSCYACQRREEYGCVIDDDLSKAVVRMLEADIIILATPLYWFGLSAQTKAVLDRMFSLSKEHTPHEHIRQATLALVVTAAGTEKNSGYQSLADQFRRASNNLTGHDGRALFALESPLDTAEFVSKAEISGLKEKAIRFGRDLAQ